VASLISRVASQDRQDVHNANPPLSIPSQLPSSPAPSFHSSPAHPSPASYSPIPSSPAAIESLYDADEMDVADGLVTDGSRGGRWNGTNNPPPYIPDLEANRPGAGNGTPLGSYSKEQDFPGLR